MQERITSAQVFKAQPEILSALLNLGEASAKTLEKSLIHLVKLRASQLNGCGYCQHMHTQEARADGERQVRLDVLPAWREVPIFTARERAALNWTEKLTCVADGNLMADDFAQLTAEFDQTEIVNLSAAIVTINAWNRIAVGFHFMPNIKDK
jgi:AhpD family alkylhydroperoxidase